MADRPIDRLIADAIRVGEEARAAVIDRAALMPMDKLAGLSPTSVALLGPGGLAKVIAKKAANRRPPSADHVAPTASPEPPKPRSHRLRAAFLSAVIVVAVGLIVERAVPMSASLMDSGTRSASTTRWPICPRLDALVDGCVYVVGGNGGLTLEGAARMLAMPPDQLAASNPHLNASFATILPSGSQIVVWREKLEIKD